MEKKERKKRRKSSRITMHQYDMLNKRLDIMGGYHLKVKHFQTALINLQVENKMLMNELKRHEKLIEGLKEKVRYVPEKYRYKRKVDRFPVI